MEFQQFDEKAFGQRLKELRIQNGMTQAEASEKFQLSVRQWQRIENGECRPSINLIVNLAVTFHVSADYLFTGKPAEKELPEDIQKKYDEFMRLAEELLEDLQALNQ